MRPYAFDLRYAAVAAIMALVAVPTANAGTALDRIVSDKTIRLGVRTDAPPFAYLKDGQLYGFSVELCGMVAEAIVQTSNLTDIAAEIVEVQTGERFKALQNGEIDVLCGATTATLRRREIVSFSIPTFMTGVGAVVAGRGPEALRDILVTGVPADHDPDTLKAAMAGKALGFRANTTAYTWLRTGPLAGIEGVELVAFGDHADGVAAVAEGRVAAYVADRAILLGVLQDTAQAERFAVSQGTFTDEPYALALPRDDEDLRLVIDLALSYLYRTGAILESYERNFGTPTPDVIQFYRFVTLPE
ncbi:MAG: amino acid ABC transporter substrate-binding protein [Alphaproteobacteria bacterium]